MTRRSLSCFDRESTSLEIVSMKSSQSKSPSRRENLKSSKQMHSKLLRRPRLKVLLSKLKSRLMLSYKMSKSREILLSLRPEMRPEEDARPESSKLTLKTLAVNLLPPRCLKLLTSRLTQSM